MPKCKNCKFWKLTSTIKEPNPSGKCGLLPTYEGWGTHAEATVCSDFEKKYTGVPTQSYIKRLIWHFTTRRKKD